MSDNASAFQRLLELLRKHHGDMVAAGQELAASTSPEELAALHEQIIGDLDTIERLKEIVRLLGPALEGDLLRQAEQKLREAKELQPIVEQLRRLVVRTNQPDH